VPRIPYFAVDIHQSRRIFCQLTVADWFFLENLGLADAIKTTGSAGG
jgi:hypothetical protein